MTPSIPFMHPPIYPSTHPPVHPSIYLSMFIEPSPSNRHILGSGIQSGLLGCTTPGQNSHGYYIDICIDSLDTEVHKKDKVFGMNLSF